MISSAQLGAAACLSAASIWALTLAAFRRPIEEHGARAINLIKCTLAAVFLGATVWLTGQGTRLLAAGRTEILLLAASGLVGLTVGDTALFSAVGRLGTYRAVLLQTLAPVCTVILAVELRGEGLGGGRFPGMILTMVGIALVITQSRPLRREPGGIVPARPDVVGLDGAAAPDGEAASEARSLPARSQDRARVQWTGVGMGLLSALCQGTGVVLAKAGMSDLTFVPASFVRLATAAAGLIVMEAVTGRLRASLVKTSAHRTLVRIVPAAFIGSYVGIMLMMAGLERSPASVAAVLLSTTPVISLLLDAARGRERLTLRGVTGTLLAVAGVGLVSH